MYTKRIEGLDENESDEVLKKLYAHQERLDLTCRFKGLRMLLRFGIIEALNIKVYQIFFLKGIGTRKE